MRLFAGAAIAVALGSVVALPAEAAATKVVYGYAWADGQGHLRIVPKSATFVKATGGFVGYRLKPVSGAKEVRLDYTKATKLAFGRVTVACDLKETEGRVAVDRKGLGRTACKPADLAAGLQRGVTPLRVEYRGSMAVKINEFLVDNWPNSRTGRGTIKRINDNSVLFATGGKTIKLGYSYTTFFYRATARCPDGWLAGEPVNAGKNGLGKMSCSAADLTKVLKSQKHPVLVQLRYSPEVGGIDEVWEIYGDA
ncbi:hypothetical protein ETD86_14570 [Nonomuraea turkmeniaca]|uniref:Uncharacterized protein n=1 Tax=Nonomuraea turkmeniaca TaxID=103838 RepID=A0A5S4FLP0_9ACTN|nr:hypothetical protein [Nonomuraea turkmeniaca]TMR21646.1 hypothetical protein ETD86_14570 [Nonomuraea turkmeniaca]